MPISFVLRTILGLATPLPQLPPISVPAPVRHAWEARDTGTAQWQAAADHSYEAIFTVHGVRTGTRYDAAGQLLETRVVIGSFDLPEPVRKAVIRELRRYHILESWRVDLPGKQPPQFVVECDNIRQAVTARFDANGQLLSRVARPTTHAGTR